MQIVIDEPIEGVAHSLQSRDGGPLHPQCSKAGEPLTFDFAIRVAPGPNFFGDQVRREGPERRFADVRVGQMAGGPGSPWALGKKIDIHMYRPGHARPRDAQADSTAGRLAFRSIPLQGRRP